MSRAPACTSMQFDRSCAIFGRTSAAVRGCSHDRAGASTTARAEAGPDEQDPLLKGVRLRGERYTRWLREGDPSVTRRLAQIGVLGWIIVVPLLIGVFVGRWLDQKFNSGLFWTAPLLMLGLALGCWSAWKWMQERMSIPSFDTLAGLGRASRPRRPFGCRIRTRYLVFPQPVVERPPVRPRKPGRRPSL